MTPASGDGGIDVRGTLVVGDVIRTRMAVQVKRWKRNVQAPTVQQVRGSLGTHEQGLIVTTSDFRQGGVRGEVRAAERGAGGADERGAVGAAAGGERYRGAPDVV